MVFFLEFPMDVLQELHTVQKAFIPVDHNAKIKRQEAFDTAVGFWSDL